MPKVTSENNMPWLDFNNELILTRNDIAWEMRNHETPIGIRNANIRGIKKLGFFGKLKQMWLIWKWLS